MKIPELRLPAVIQQWQNRMQNRFGQLPARDQMALTGLALFMTVFVLLLMVMFSHRYYTHSYTGWQNALQTRFWMQQVAPQLTTDTMTGSGDVQTLVNTTAGQQGISANIRPTGDSARVEVTASHPTYAALASWLTRVSATGGKIDQLTLRQEPGKGYQLTATISQ